MRISTWSAHAALQSRRPAIIADTLTIRFQVFIIIALHAENEWQRLARRSGSAWTRCGSTWTGTG
ncbi:hypothetical protein XspCFBP7912_09590 [Xanthomonas sp. CFBP 7912]|nr:hypothetical protein XspCFBP7912_09590 [Xanthomonas sp. CFBP 7912]RJS02644.1 hypothetical protein XnspCFBP7698_16210 [Xanthomonas sp. CFBP 7698]